MNAVDIKNGKFLSIVLMANLVLFYIASFSDSVYGQCDTNCSVKINARAAAQKTEFEPVSIGTVEADGSTKIDSQVSRLLQEYIQQLVRDEPEIEGCMEG